MLKTTEISQKKEQSDVQKKTSPLEFSQWLVKQARRSDSVGCLARSISKDKCWPHSAKDYISFRTHLRVEHADCPIEQIMALDIAWEEYFSLHA
ncbi:MAG: YozE family protein [Nitrososphaerales archaeon]